MGLDTTHDCWHGAYSAFSRWRNKLAEVAGYKLEKHGDPPIFDGPAIDWNAITELNVQGHWNETPEDALLVIFAHSDCDGVIFPEQALPLAERLEELLPLLEEDGGGHIGSYKDKTQEFIDGLRLAASRDEVVQFH